MRKHRALFVTAVLGAAAFLIAADAPTSQPSKRVTASGLTIEETGSTDFGVASPGDRVWVEYTGKLTDGTKFDSSLDHAPDKPFTFVIGHNEVIAGWDEGIAGMKVGDKRHLIIPPNLGYGASGGGPIPPNATIVFDVQLLGIKKGS